MQRPDPTAHRPARPGLVPPTVIVGALAALLLTTGAVVHHALAPATVDRPAVAADDPAPIDAAAAPGAGRADPRPPAAPSAYDPARRGLDLRIDGLTLADALDGITRYAHGDRPEHSRWLYRVSGLLYRHPEHCAAFAAAALADDATVAMQALAADVLAGVGHGPAQGALRDLIDRSALGPAVRHRLLQSHLQVQTPAPEAADWLARQLDDPRVGPAAANALGAVAGRLAETHPAEAEAALDRLRTGLRRADDAHGQRAHLSGLGNSGQPAAIDAVPYAGSDDPDVRAAAARALRHLDAPAARQALLGLVADPDGRVQARAVEALAIRLGAAELPRLVGVMQAGALDPSAEGVLLAAGLRAHQPHRIALLEGLVAGARVPRVRERARVALLSRAP